MQREERAAVLPPAGCGGALLRVYPPVSLKEGREKGRKEKRPENSHTSIVWGKRLSGSHTEGLGSMRES